MPIKPEWGIYAEIKKIRSDLIIYQYASHSSTMATFALALHSSTIATIFSALHSGTIATLKSALHASTMATVKSARHSSTIATFILTSTTYKYTIKRCDLSSVLYSDKNSNREISQIITKNTHRIITHKLTICI